MSDIICKLICAGLLAISLLPAATIRFEVTELAASLGAGGHRITFTVDEVSFGSNHELDIRFDPAVFEQLSNPVAGPGFDVLVLQPDNPPGSFGDYSLLSLVDNPALDGPFSVDAILAGGMIPASLPFSISELDPETFEVLRTLESGSALNIRAIPEPGTLVAGMLALAVVLGRVKLRTGRAKV